MSEYRIGAAVSSGSVKRLLFHPSNRTLWIVVGRDNEHWTDPELGFCTCKDFYFTSLSGGQECYHLKSTAQAIREKKLVTLEFDDSEYLQILRAIARDHAGLLGGC
jgi:predicted nucleic acid-binding Zn finger protein